MKLLVRYSFRQQIELDSHITSLCKKASQNLVLLQEEIINSLQIRRSCY